MPSPTIKCEFCENHEMRRDAYAAHVRAKHTKEIALLMLKDFKENKINTISSHASDKSIKSMVIESVKYQDAEYWFGVKPLFYIRESNEVAYDPTRPDTKCKAYPEDLELAQYLKRDENLTSHKSFIEECFKELSYFDFMNQQKHLVFRDASVITMKNELLSLKKENEALRDITNRERERLQKEIELWKETADEKEFIADIKKELGYYKSQASRVQQEMNYMKRAYQEKDKERDENISSMNQSRCNELVQAHERNDLLQNEIEKLKKTMDKKVQKLFEKEHKTKEKMKDKKVLDKEKAKKAAKKAKKLAEMSDSESDASDSE